MSVPGNQRGSWRIEVGHGSDVGRRRRTNEDGYGVAVSQAGGRLASRGYLYVVPPPQLAKRGRLYVVADGMGGHSAGALASALATQAMFHAYYRGPFAGVRTGLLRAIEAANQAILARAQSGDPAVADMGSTLVAAVVLGSQATVAHVGDSRCYLVNASGVQQVTQDHTWVREQVAAGVLTALEAQGHPYRHVITRSLGRADVTPEILTLGLQPGDRLVLCSDGLSNLVTPAELRSLVLRYPPQAAVEQLIALANQRGGPDNITAVVVRVDQPIGVKGMALSFLGGLSPLRKALAVTALVLIGLLVMLGVRTLLVSPSGAQAPKPTRVAIPTEAKVGSPTAAAVVPDDESSFAQASPTPQAGPMPTPPAAQADASSTEVVTAVPDVTETEKTPASEEVATTDWEAFINIPGGGVTYLFRDPRNEQSGIIKLSQGQLITIIGKPVKGIRAYGTDEYYPAEVKSAGTRYEGYVSAGVVKPRY